MNILSGKSEAVSHCVHLKIWGLRWCRAMCTKSQNRFVWILVPRSLVVIRISDFHLEMFFFLFFCLAYCCVCVLSRSHAVGFCRKIKPGRRQTINKHKPLRRLQLLRVEESLRHGRRFGSTECLIVTYIRGTNNKPFPQAFFFTITNNSLSPSLSHFKCCPHNRHFHPLPSAAELRLPNLRYRCQLWIFTQVFIAYWSRWHPCQHLR